MTTPFNSLHQNSKIRLFRDSQFVGVRSRSVIEALFARSLVRLERNAKGLIIAAHEVHVAVQRSSVPSSSSTGGAVRPIRYSFQDPAITGKPWDLRRLSGARTGINYAPAALRPLFLRVVLECLR